MSSAASRPSLQQRVAATILDGAARAFAIRGDQTSMTDVAETAGVARATVYRYFPNRGALLDELARTALDDVEARLALARIDEVAPEEGVTRAVRALVEVGDPFDVLAHRRQADPRRFEDRLVAPVRRLIERGQAENSIRGDVSASRLTEVMLGLIPVLLRSSPAMGVDDMAATIAGLFLDGARGRRLHSV